MIFHVNRTREALLQSEKSLHVDFKCKQVVL